jgi:site-specific recombinase XerD
MRKRNAFTILEKAVAAVPEFEPMLKKLSQQVILRGQSKSTMDNYSRRITLFVIHFNRLPEQVSEDKINEYLAALARDPKSPSRSSFKHMVYGLRYYYRLPGMNKKFPKQRNLLTSLYLFTNGKSTKTCPTSKNVSIIFLQKTLKSSLST